MPDSPETPDLIGELKWRGLFHQCTDEQGLRKHLADADLSRGGRRAYCGFDPTADSLTIGNLVPILLLRHWQRAGHTPVVVMGGGTGLIGDPSGKSAERPLMTEEQVRGNVESQMRIFERLLDFSGATAAVMVNNADWLAKLGFIDVLRDVGKHFSVNEMVKRDSIRERLEGREHGISYTEFSYMLLQAYDFLHLYKTRAVTVQLAGSDQWGNIVAGIDLIRKHEPSREREGAERIPRSRSGLGVADSPAFGLTAPLVAKADGGKFGKTESGAIWLTADRTSPYAFHQFWLNSADEDVKRWIRLFTFLPHDEVESLEASLAADPGRREAHRALARHVTAMVHGESAMRHAEHAAQALFSGDVAGLDLATLNDVFASAPSSEHPRESLFPNGISLLDLLPRTTLCKSKREAREHLSAGAVSVNGRPVGPEDRLTADMLLHGSIAAIRRGKKSWHVTRWK